LTYIFPFFRMHLRRVAGLVPHDPWRSPRSGLGSDQPLPHAHRRFIPRHGQQRPVTKCSQHWHGKLKLDVDDIVGFTFLSLINFVCFCPKNWRKQKNATACTALFQLDEFFPRGAAVSSQKLRNLQNLLQSYCTKIKQKLPNITWKCQFPHISWPLSAYSAALRSKSKK
jgi:hypothetical protein